MNKNISIIIPTLNEEATLSRTLDALRPFADEAEIIVADGGSTDATIAIAQARGAQVVTSERGRGQQLKRGAKEAGGSIFWFVHADTLSAPSTVFEIKKALDNPEVAGGNFTINFDGDAYSAKFLTWLYPKLNILGLIYGDSAIFVRREIYERIGGFRDYPIFEDLDFIERLRETGDIVTLPATVTTSSRRFENKSFLLTFLRWMILQGLYWLGVPPEMLLKIYFPDFKPNNQRSKTF